MTMRSLTSIQYENEGIMKPRHNAKWLKAYADGWELEMRENIELLARALTVVNRAPGIL